MSYLVIVGQYYLNLGTSRRQAVFLSRGEQHIKTVTNRPLRPICVLLSINRIFITILQ